MIPGNTWRYLEIPGNTWKKVFYKLYLSLQQMCCFLTSYFNSLLPTKRNLITHLDCLLVVAMTFLTSEMVDPPFLITPKQIAFPQAITHTILFVVGPLPLQLALLWSNVLYWTMYIN